jgi:4-amino-4-deoxy-L-arabinose transferase-like glycosyltransferase
LTSKQRTALLLAILLLASLVRLVDLGRNPPGFFCDEASVGYDAYSLLHTARDQYGAFLPLFARSLGDYDEALLRYLTVPSIAVFGLNEFATRLPAALVGTLTVLLVFLLAGELFSRDDISLMAALLLAISPWHVLFSRVAFRAVLLPFCFCLALWLFLKGLKAPRLLIAAAAAFALALWDLLFRPCVHPPVPRRPGAGECAKAAADEEARDPGRSALWRCAGSAGHVLAVAGWHGARQA